MGDPSSAQPVGGLQGQPPAGGAQGAAAGGAQAQGVGPDVKEIEQIALEDLLGKTVTASKTEMRVQEAPSIVHVITSRQIRQRGYRTVADALKHVPGIYGIDDHTYMNIGVRGVFSAPQAANDVVKVMINGQPIAFRSTAVSFMEHDLLPIEAVKRIEILRGPASALYGANAFLGVINIITFQGGAKEGNRRGDHGLVLDGYYMQNPHGNSYNGTGSFYSGGSIGERFKYFVSGTAHYSDRSGLQVPGLDDMIQERLNRTDPSIMEAADGAPSPGWDASAREFMLRNPVNRDDVERTGSGYALMTFEATEDIDVEVDGHFQYFDRGAEFQNFSFLTHDTRLTHLNGYVRTRFLYGQDKEEGLSLRLSTAFASGTPTNQEQIADRLVSDQLKRRDMGYRAFDAVAEARYTLGPRDHITLGADYSLDHENLLSIDVRNQRTGEVTEQPGFGTEDFHNVGVYAQWMWNVWESLVVTLGSRMDYNSQIACNAAEWDCVGGREDVVEENALPGGRDAVIDDRGLFQLSNRAALVYEFPVAGLYAKAIYGSSFKPPSPFQLYHRQLTITGASAGNPALQPQTADTAEAAIGLEPIDGLHAELNGYFTRVDDFVLVFKETSLLEGRNADVRTAGLEGSLTYTWQRNMSVFFNGSWMAHSEVQPKQKRGETDAAWRTSPLNTTVPVGRYPEYMLNGGVNFHLPEAHVNINLALQFVSERRASLINNQLQSSLDLEDPYTLDRYMLADLTVRSVGLHLFGERETVFSASVRGAPGAYEEPGIGGIDVPSRGTRFHFRMEQQL
jgi:iron complex outermembrane receptor protein